MCRKIFVNTLLILILIILTEFVCFYITKKENLSLNKKTSVEYITKYNVLKDFNADIYGKSFKQKDEKKNPIILFGCSYADGAGLSEENTPCGKLSKITGRSCINRAKGAMGLQFMNYQLKNQTFYDKNKEVDYVIYVYIRNHLQRLYNFQMGALIDMFNLRYKVSNGKLREIKPIFKPLYSSYIVKRFLNKKAEIQAQIEEKNFKLFNAVMNENVRLVKKYYPKAKIIFIEYPEPRYHSLPDKEVDILENMGIIVVKIVDLTKDINIFDNEYWLDDNIHPSEKAWNIILPRLAKKYLD